MRLCQRWTTNWRFPYQTDYNLGWLISIHDWWTRPPAIFMNEPGTWRGIIIILAELWIKSARGPIGCSLELRSSRCDRFKLVDFTMTDSMVFHYFTMEFQWAASCTWINTFPEAAFFWLCRGPAGGHPWCGSPGTLPKIGIPLPGWYRNIQWTWQRTTQVSFKNGRSFKVYLVGINMIVNQNLYSFTVQPLLTIDR